MDSVYDVTLLMSLAGGAAALAFALLARMQAGPAPDLAGWVLPAAFGAWFSFLMSVTVHLVWGHAPGSPQALSPVEFLREHPAFIVAALIPALAMVGRPKGESRDQAGT